MTSKEDKERIAALEKQNEELRRQYEEVQKCLFAPSADNARICAKCGGNVMDHY